MKQHFSCGSREGLPGMRRNLKLIKTVRDVIGPDIELAVDVYMRWDRQYTTLMVHMLEDAGMNLEWVEEPLMPDDNAGHAQLYVEVDAPISAREQEFTRYGIRMMIDRHTVDILQMGMNCFGGITETGNYGRWR